LLVVVVVRVAVVVTAPVPRGSHAAPLKVGYTDLILLHVY
jgi:hypothetical protein